MNRQPSPLGAALRRSYFRDYARNRRQNDPGYEAARDLQYWERKADIIRQAVKDLTADEAIILKAIEADKKGRKRPPVTKSD